MYNVYNNLATYKENFHVIMMTNNDNILLKYRIIRVNRINGFFCLVYTVF